MENTSINDKKQVIRYFYCLINLSTASRMVIRNIKKGGLYDQYSVHKSGHYAGGGWTT